MAGVEVVKVKQTDDGMRLNRWFLKYYPLLTMGRLQKLLRTKQIKVDGKKAESNLKLAMGQEIRVPPLDNEKAQNNVGFVSKSDEEFIKSKVIFKDDNIIVSYEKCFVNQKSKIRKKSCNALYIVPLLWYNIIGKKKKGKRNENSDRLYLKKRNDS